MTTAIAALPFFGGTLSGFDPTDTTVEEVTTSGTYNSTFATCGLLVSATPYPDYTQTSFASSPTWAAASTFWKRFSCFINPELNPESSDRLLSRFYNGATEVARITVQDPTFTVGNFKLWTLQSGTMTVAGTWTAPIFDVLNIFDVQIVSNTASGSVAVYSAGNLVSGFPVTGLDHSGFTGVEQVILQSGLASTVWSQVICDTTSTVGRFIRTDRLNTNSATNTGWTGTVTDINEIPTSDANFISAASANLVSTFFETGQSLTGYNILARGVSARMRTETNGSGPQNIELAIRSGSTNFFSSSIGAGTGFQASFNSWTTDPNTSAAWTAANAQVAESGAKSIA